MQNKTKTWIDYYNQRATDFSDSREIGDFFMGNQLASEDFLAYERDRILKALDPKENSHLLDLGCCAGVMLGQLKEHFSKLTGVDLAESALKVARKKIPQARFIQDDIQSLSKIETNTFDSVLTYGVLQFLNDDTDLEQYIEALSRVMKNGARAALFRMPNKEHFDRYQEFRQSRRLSRTLSDDKLAWYWIDPNTLHNLAKGKFEIFSIYPSYETDYPLRGFFDAVLIRR